MEKLKQNKVLIIGIFAVLLIAAVALVWIFATGDNQSGGKDKKGSSTGISGYSETLPQYTKALQYENQSLSDGKKRITFDVVAGSLVQYANQSGIDSLYSSQNSCVTVCTFDYSAHTEAFASDWVNTYLESRKFTLTDGYVKNENGMEVVMSIGTMPGFTDMDTSCILIVRTETTSLLIVVTGDSKCAYTEADIAQIREAAYVIFDTLGITDIPNM